MSWESSNEFCGVIWITGLSGSGKTFLSKRLIKKYQEQGFSPVHLDGDDLRLVFEANENFNYKMRLSLAKMYSKLSSLLAKQGHIVVVSTISLFHEVHTINRQNTNYCEIYIESTTNNLRNQNSRGIWVDSGGNRKKEVVGNDIEPEFPLSPDRIIASWHDDHKQINLDELYAFTLTKMISK